MHDRDSAIIAIEYREGEEVYQIRAHINLEILFSRDSAHIVGETAKGMWHEIERKLENRALPVNFSFCPTFTQQG